MPRQTHQQPSLFRLTQKILVMCFPRLLVEVRVGTHWMASSLNALSAQVKNVVAGGRAGRRMGPCGCQAPTTLPFHLKLDRPVVNVMLVGTFQAPSESLWQSGSSR